MKFTRFALPGAAAVLAFGVSLAALATVEMEAMLKILSVFSDVGDPNDSEPGAWVPLFLALPLLLLDAVASVYIGTRAFRKCRELLGARRGA